MITPIFKISADRTSAFFLVGSTVILGSLGLLMSISDLPRLVFGIPQTRSIPYSLIFLLTSNYLVIFLISYLGTALSILLINLDMIFDRKIFFYLSHGYMVFIAMISLSYYGIGIGFGIEHQGKNYILHLVIFNLVMLVAFLYLCRRQKGKGGVPLHARMIFAFWQTWLAFPWLGESF